MTWAWSISLPPTPKLVLMALADIADDKGVCWPSHASLALKCSLTDRTVRRVLTHLQNTALIEVEPRFSPNGSRSSNRYRLRCENPQDNPSGALGSNGGGGGHRCPGPPDTRVLGTTIEPPIESSQVPLRRTRATVSELGGDLIFPRKLDDPQKQALRKGLSALDPVTAQQLLDELAGRMAIVEVKNPLRYCAILFKRLRTGTFTPELGLNVAAARASEGRRAAALLEIETKAAAELLRRPCEPPVALRNAIERMRAKKMAPSP